MTLIKFTFLHTHNLATLDKKIVTFQSHKDDQHTSTSIQI